MRHACLPLRPRRTPLVVAAAAAFTLAALPAVAADAAGPAKRCPAVGRTLAVERFDGRVTSRIWRAGGVTSGCTVLRGGRTRTSVLTRRPTGVVRLDDDTVAWTTPAGTGAGATARVSLFDLRYGWRALRAVPAVPSTGPGAPRRQGTVDALRVYASGFVAWIANGTTVVVGADPDAAAELVAADGTQTPLRLEGPLAVAAAYPADPATAARLRASLTIGAVPGDPGDADDCAYSYATAFRWESAPGQVVEARLRGTRTTPDLCGGE